MKNKKEYLKVYKDFWKPIFGFFGLFKFNKVKKELYDYYNILDMVTKVYMAVTYGEISKPNTLPYEVINTYQNHIDSNYISKYDIKDILINRNNENLRKVLIELVK